MILLQTGPIVPRNDLDGLVFGIVSAVGMIGFALLMEWLDKKGVKCGKQKQA